MLNNNSGPSISQKHQHSSQQSAIDPRQRRHSRRLRSAPPILTPHLTQLKPGTEQAFSATLPLQRECSRDAISEQRQSYRAPLPASVPTKPSRGLWTGSSEAECL